MPLTLTRSLLVVLVPGLVALAPWLLWLVREFSDIAHLYREFPQAIAAAVFAAVVLVGSTIENFNSYVEDLWDQEREKEWAVTANWYAYWRAPLIMSRLATPTCRECSRPCTLSSGWRVRPPSPPSA